MKFFISIILLVLFTGCTDKQSAQKLLTSEGYTDITFEGYSFFGCSRDDTFRTDFTAIKNNKRVKGTVCGGFLHGSVVRIKG